MDLSPITFLTVLLALLASCSTTYVTPLRRPPHALTPRSPDDVEVFTAKPPDRPFTEVALVGAMYGLGELTKKAAEVGCDAIFLLAPGRDYRSGATQAACLVYDTQ